MGYGKYHRYYFFFSSFAGTAAAAGAAVVAAAGVAPAAGVAVVASSCFNWRVSTTDALGILGEFNISYSGSFTSSTRILPFRSRLVISTSICSFRFFGKDFTLSDFIFMIK